MNDILPINWIDGMKINKSHFIHNDQLLEVSLRQHTFMFMKSYEYGLFPVHLSQLSKPMITIEDSRLRLHWVVAVNRRGEVLKVGASDHIDFDLRTLEPNIIIEGQKFIVILSKDSKEKVEYGEPLENESPPRQPFVKDKYALNLIEESKMNSEEFVLSYVSIGRLLVLNGQLQMDPSYIPPCHQVLCHPVLQDRYNSIENAISEIGINATQVVQNAKSKKKRGEINDLAENTFYLMEKIVFFLAQYMHNIRTTYKEESPVVFFSFLNSFGRIVLTTLKCLKSEDKEALLRYYESHLGLKPHQFESDMKELGQLQYDHLHLNDIFDIADQHITMLKTFASKATQLEFHSVERVDVLTEGTVGRKKLDIF